MIIEKILMKVWEPAKVRYDAVYRQYMALDAQDIEDEILLRADTRQMIAEDNSFSRMTVLPTAGCPHWNHKDVFTGCSFCDNFTDNLDGIAIMTALKDKDHERYASVICQLLERSRSEKPGCSVMENITAYDSLSDYSIPFNQLLQIYQSGDWRRNLIYLGLETRAENVHPNKLRLLKRKVCKRIMVECGMEVSDEWMRNHWLNKQTSDQQLWQAINSLKKEECIAAVDILLGVPGLTPIQNKNVFIKTFEKAISLGADYVIVSPLMRHNNNLPNYLYQHLRDDAELARVGIVNGIQTGIVDLLIVYDAFIELFQKHPDYIKRMIFSPVRSHNYFNALKQIYHNHRYEHAVLTLLKGLIEFSRTKNTDILTAGREAVRLSRYYMETIDYFETTKAINLQDTMILLIDRLLKKLYPENHEDMKREFQQEIACFACTD